MSIKLVTKTKYSLIILESIIFLRKRNACWEITNMALMAVKYKHLNN